MPVLSGSTRLCDGYWLSSSDLGARLRQETITSIELYPWWDESLHKNMSGNVGGFHLEEWLHLKQKIGPIPLLRHHIIKQVDSDIDRLKRANCYCFHNLIVLQYVPNATWLNRALPNISLILYPQPRSNKIAARRDRCGLRTFFATQENPEIAIEVREQGTKILLELLAW